MAKLILLGDLRAWLKDVNDEQAATWKHMAHLHYGDDLCAMIGESDRPLLELLVTALKQEATPNG